MADSSRTLKMVAQVVDQFSGPIREMKKSLDQLGDRQGKTSKEGARQAIAILKL